MNLEDSNDYDIVKFKFKVSFWFLCATFFSKELCMKFLFIMNINICCMAKHVTCNVSEKEWTTEYLSCPILLSCFSKICSIQFIYKKVQQMKWCGTTI